MSSQLLLLSLLLTSTTAHPIITSLRAHLITRQEPIQTEDPSIAGGAIAGIAVGCVISLFIVVLIITSCIRANSQRNDVMNFTPQARNDPNLPQYNSQQYHTSQPYNAAYATRPQTENVQPDDTNENPQAPPPIYTKYNKAPGPYQKAANVTYQSRTPNSMASAGKYQRAAAATRANRSAAQANNIAMMNASAANTMAMNNAMAASSAASSAAAASSSGGFSGGFSGGAGGC